ncbi:hypothetical protein [Acuticoccus sediminis]|uniref:hypothetical protein n=1 Tax=Acuticoccus sediminis TaxID=2184697 RepID=UPI001CFD4664|nr:hypothetical protein [Acuticoccus sediminis]
MALAIVTALLTTSPADAGPLPGFAPEVGAGVELVQGYCGRQNFVCQRNFGQGRRYRRCMARSGCAVRGGGNGGGNRCEARARFCARRFQNGSRQFNRCMRRGGC